MAWVYLHGMPGSHHEAALFGFETGAMFIPDRTGEALDIPTLAREVEARFPNSPVSLIGFSMGTFVAVQLAVALGDKVDQIHLIAPAAPITDDRLLTAMAGAPIFRLARRSSRLFRAVTRLQAMLGAVAPRLIFRSLFATAKGDERDLAADPEFERRWTAMARHCLRKGAPGYGSEILAFVKDWSSLPARVKAPVTVWHGMEDTLTPPTLVESLIAALPQVVAVRCLPKAGHYSTLKVALSQISGAKTGVTFQRIDKA
jgi:pimeloyl-ACP methyl ester carboxylesterase